MERTISPCPFDTDDDESPFEPPLLVKSNNFTDRYIPPHKRQFNDSDDEIAKRKLEFYKAQEKRKAIFEEENESEYRNDTPTYPFKDKFVYEKNNHYPNDHDHREERRLMPFHMNNTLGEERRFRPSHLDTPIGIERSFRPSHLDNRLGEERRFMPYHLNNDHIPVQNLHELREDYFSREHIPENKHEYAQAVKRNRILRFKEMQKRVRDEFYNLASQSESQPIIDISEENSFALNVMKDSFRKKIETCFNEADIRGLVENMPNDDESIPIKANFYALEFNCKKTINDAIEKFYKDIYEGSPKEYTFTIST